MGAVVGPALAFYLLWLFSNDYRTIFWFSMVPGVVAVVLIVLFIKERGSAPLSAIVSERPRLTLRHFDWRFRSFVIIAAIFSLGNSSDMFLILKAQQTGIPIATIPLLYLLFNLIYSLSAIPAGMAADRFGKKRVILIGFILFAGLYYGFAVAGSVVSIWILFCLYGLFMGLTEEIQKAFLATIIPQEFKATAFGVYNTAVGFAMLPASIIGGWLWDHISPAATFYFGAITATISAILFVIFIAAVRRDQGAL